MSNENEYIEHPEEQEQKPKRKRSKRSSGKKTSKKTGKKKQGAISKALDKIDRKKLNRTSGTIFLILSLFILLSCFSYLLTWNVDQNRVIGKGLFEFIFSENIEEVNNWGGKLGAWLSHLLLYRWFGLASFGFSLIFLVLGLKTLFKIEILPVKRTVSISLVFIVWTSVFLAYFIQSINHIGGNFGNQINDWLGLTLGKIGALIVILSSGYIFAVLLFNEALSRLLERIGLLKKKNVDEKSEVLTDEVLEEDDLKVVNTITEDQKEQDIVSETVLLDGVEDEEKEKEVIEEESRGPETEVTVEESVVIDETSDNLETDDDTFSVTVAESPETDEEVSQDELPKNFEDMGEYDPKLDLSNYTLPPIDLLKDYGKKGVNVDKSELEANKNKIVETLANYKIEISKIMATVGPTVTLYEIVPAPGVRISKIKNLEDDIALSLAALGIRIIAPIPGKGTIGIEVPNSKPEMVSMRSLIASRKFQEANMELPVVMGKTITNETYTFDLTKMPHLLVAGATGQGKSVGLNAILVSILYKKHPAQVKFVLVDPKKVELTLYNKIERHFLAKLPDEEDAIITDTSKVVNTLNSLTIEMDERYELLKTAHCRTIKEYNAKFIKRKLNPEKGHRYLPYIVVLIDEFADLIMTAGKEVEQPIARLAQLARAIGIHLIVATQRPSVNVITGMIKANFPARIAFRVLSKIDSRTILDASGADQLIGRGDMLISTGQDLVRLQCGFVDTPEVEDICDFIGDQRAYPEAFKLPEFVGEGAEGGGSMDDEELDALFADAARIVVMHQQGSASLLQRKLKLGYNRAGRIIDQLEGMGIIGPFKGSKARDVLYSDENALEELLASKGLV